MGLEKPSLKFGLSQIWKHRNKLFSSSFIISLKKIMVLERRRNSLFALEKIMIFETFNFDSMCYQLVI